MGIVLEAKKQLEQQGCNPEILENAFRAYGSQEQIAWERIKFLEAEVTELKEELNEIEGASRRVVDGIECTLERVVNLEIDTLEDKVRFKEMQHELYRILDIINLLKRLS